jgi:hypothetical protein
VAPGKGYFTRLQPPRSCLDFQTIHWSEWECRIFIWDAPDILEKPRKYDNPAGQSLGFFTKKQSPGKSRGQKIQV